MNHISWFSSSIVIIIMCRPLDRFTCSLWYSNAKRVTKFWPPSDNCRITRICTKPPRLVILGHFSCIKPPRLVILVHFICIKPSRLVILGHFYLHKTTKVGHSVTLYWTACCIIFLSFMALSVDAKVDEKRRGNIYQEYGYTIF